MKVKEIERTANMAWSPAGVPRIMLAAGTAAQQLDATFSSASRLEILGLGLDDSSLAMPVIAAVDTPARFHSVAWGGVTGARPCGIVVGGSDGGSISLYDAAGLLEGRDAKLAAASTGHTGMVRALDFNPFQSNLLASGAAASELYIWDLNSPQTPMTPGAPVQPPEDVSAVSWNRQVQHILASTFSSSCVVWDLRKNEPIIKVSDGQAGMKCKVVAWHPDVATQLVLASEDDVTPTIQLWDLRFATSPLRTLQRHTKGILSLAWSDRDSHLLLSAGKDDKILCWDPHSEAPGGEVVAELCASPQWNFSVRWCPRSPALAAVGSFDGRISVYNVLGGGEEPPQPQPAALADSFPSMSGVAAALPASQRRTSVPLARPPNWLRRPCGATFGFGGRLVTFGEPAAAAEGQRPQRLVEVHQVVTEQELVQRAQRFQEVLLSDQLPAFCAERATAAPEQDRAVWSLLAARMDLEPRQALLRQLGYPPQGQEPDQVSDEGMQESPAEGAAPAGGGDDFDFVGRSSGGANSESPTAEPEELFDIPTGDDADGQITQALLRGDMREAVTRCLTADRTADALIVAMATSQQLFEQTRDSYLQSMKTDMSRLISALVTRDWSAVVSRCDPGSWREALVAVLTHAPPEQTSPLCEALGGRLEQQHTESMWTSALLCYVCAGSVDKLVACLERTRPDATSPEAAQDVIEQALVLRRAAQQVGVAPGLTSAGVQTKLLRLAELLASQGSLETALSYLGECGAPEAVALCERLQRALAPSVQQQGRQVAPTSRQAATRLPSGGSAYPQPSAHVQPNMHAPSQPTPVFQPPTSVFQPPTSVFQPPTGQFSPGTQFQPPTGQFSPGTQFQPPVAPVAPLVPQPTPVPQPPSSAAAPTGGYRLGGRRQYAADPTVMGGVGGVSGGYPGQYGLDAGYQPQSSYSPSVPQPAVSSAQYGQVAAPQPDVFTPNFSTPAYQPPAPSNSVYQPSPQPVQPEMPGAVPGVVAPAVSSGPGWNDPPPLRASKKAASITSPLTAVTQPIYNPAEMMQPMQPYGAHPGQYGAPSPGQMPAYQPQQPQFTAPPASLSPAPAPAPAPAPPPEPPAPKGPVPAEHEVLQTTLDRLRDVCAASAPSPQIRRRLDDVTRKLEALYDILRAGRLSATTAQGLHQLMQYLQYGDMASAQQVVANVVATSNFAEVSAFMPGVKSLVQIAAQLQVKI